MATLHLSLLPHFPTGTHPTNYISVGMANRNDPDAITQDYSAYIFVTILRGLGNPLSRISGDDQTVAHHWGSLHVRLLKKTSTSLSESFYDP